MSSSPEREMAVCREHGLRYDRATQSGCVICRREGGAPDSMPSSRPPSAAEPEAEGRDLKTWAVVGVCVLVVLGGLGSLFMPQDGDVYEYLQHVRDHSQFEGEEAETLRRFQRIDELIEHAAPGVNGRTFRLAEETREVMARRRQEIAALAKPLEVESAADAIDQIFVIFDSLIDTIVAFLRFVDGLEGPPSNGISPSAERTFRALAADANRLATELRQQCGTVNGQIEALVEDSAPRWSRTTMTINFCEPDRNW